MNRARRIMDRVWAMIWVRLPIVFFRPKNNTHQVDVIISLTSYPARINHVSLTIRSLLMQTLNFSKIVLTLSLEEFPNGLGDLPKNLNRLLERYSTSFEVNFTTDNKKSYKKLLPIISQHPNSILITVDDDVIYWRSFAQSLYNGHKKHHQIIIGTRGTTMLSSIKGFEPYSSWPQAISNVENFNIFLTGRGGILYPPNSLDSRVIDWDLAKNLCPNADDVWFKAMALLAGTASMVIKTEREYPSSGASQTIALWRKNVDGGENDLVLQKTFAHFKINPALDANE